MDDKNENMPEGLIQPEASALARRSANLVKRGLATLNHGSWRTAKVAEDLYFGSVSPYGVLCTCDERSSSQEHVIRIINVERPEDAFTISAPAHYTYYDTDGTLWGTLEGHVAEGAVSFAWSPCGNYIVTGSGNHERALRLFDVRRRRYVEVFGTHGDDLYWLAWSRNGEFFASASDAYDPHLKLWRCQWSEDLFGRNLKAINYVSGLTSIEGYPRQYFDKERNEFRGLYGFHYVEFSPCEKYLAAAASIRDGEDFIVIFDTPSLEEVCRIPTGGNVTDLSWAESGKTIMFIQGGQAFICSIDFKKGRGRAAAAGLDFDLCSCHQSADICAFAQGQSLSMYDEHGNRTRVGPEFVGGLISVRSISEPYVISEYKWPVGVTRLCWNREGTKLYAITRDGVAVLYELPSSYISLKPPIKTGERLPLT